MATTVSLDGLRDLASFTAENGCAITVYLDLDPSVSATAGDAQTRINALLDEGFKGEGGKSSTLSHGQREALRADADRIRTYLEQDLDRDGAHGAAVFCAGLDNFWRTLALPASVPDGVKVGRDFYLTPLVPLVGRGEGALVAVVGREQGQVYRLLGGRLQELVDRTEEQPGQHDQGGWSQARYQRHIENLVAGHLREVADELDRRVRRLRPPGIVVVCAEERRPEFADALSTEARNAVIGWTQAEAHATPADLLEVVKPELERWRSEREREAIERWREEVGRDGRAAAGWGPTLEAASDGRVDLLLYQEGAEHVAWQCPSCGRLAVGGGNCPLDGTRMEEESDGLDLAVHKALSHGGTVIALLHHRDLEPVEGIGALLRY